MRFSLAALLGVVAFVPLAGCDESESRSSISELVGPQLEYLEPDSSLVASVDLRYDGENWRHLEPVISRALELYREREDDASDPGDLDQTLQQLAQYVRLDFEDDVRPVLDGYLVVGFVEPPRVQLSERMRAIALSLAGATYDPSRDVFLAPPLDGGPGEVVVRKRDGTPLRQEDARRLSEARQKVAEGSAPRMVVTYRTRDGDLGEVARKVVRLEPVPGHANARSINSSLALVGDDTLVSVDGGDEDAALDAALDRAESGEGFPASRLETAQRDVGFADPFVLATGDLTVARRFVEEPNFRRAVREVPYLGAIERISAGVEVGEDEAAGRIEIATTGARLEPEDLPVGPAGPLALPKAEGAVGASRDQSLTTTFAARIVRALFEDSDFVGAVERTERDLGRRFEDEVLRQFDCPSVSVFEGAELGAPGVQRFAARSCVREPARMRELLPRLAPHLPRILTAMQGLGEEGLLGLLLVAPDAPLTPSALNALAQILVKPLPGGDEASPQEDLYEAHDVVSGLPVVVFGMIGDDFVVASSRERARSVARTETEKLDEEAASALRLPLELLTPGDGDSEEVLSSVFSDLELTVAAEPSATTVRARLGYEN